MQGRLIWVLGLTEAQLLHNEEWSASHIALSLFVSFRGTRPSTKRRGQTKYLQLITQLLDEWDVTNRNTAVGP